MHQTDHRPRLIRRGAAPSPALSLDAEQRRVVDHPGGPLLVLAGPGTGKTTTLVEAIAHRVTHGVPAEQILALTFSRKAAEQLRDRVTARLGTTLATSLAATFHSFAYSLIRAYSPADLYDAPLKLLSAPEADVVLRELLYDNPESVRWPEMFRAAVHTRGFTREVQAVLGRAREKGLDGAALRALGTDQRVPEFVAAGIFLDQYLTVLDSLGSTDYADLIRRAVIEAEAHREELRTRYSCVFVDEYQDTDPGQVALLRALAGDGRDLVVVGDPHQSIYAFRGAEVRGILDFPAQFPTSSGDPAPVVVLRNTRRFGPRILRAATRVAGRLTLAGSIDAEARADFLRPQCVPGDAGAGSVAVLTFDTERAEAEHLADILRRAHLDDGVAWDRMAVLVRSGRSGIPPLRRALAAAEVPVEVASDDLPLVRDPAVLPLLEALRAVVNLRNDDPTSPGYSDPGRVEALLLSPLGGLDAGDLRTLVRALRARERSRTPDGTPRTSRDLLRAVLVEPAFTDGLGGPEVARAAALADLLHGAEALLQAKATPQEVLWHLWSGAPWAERLRGRIDLGGAAARHAHRDLDAICALFESAARTEERRDHSGVEAFLESLSAQQIPADTLAESGVRGAAVRLLTAHRSKGLEWDLVVVAHVQAETWPDLRRRSSLLGADRIGSDLNGQAHLLPPVTARSLLMDERRLFYVACTRARRRLVVTAVRSGEDEGEQPSRFLDELGVTVEHLQGRPRRPLSLGGLVAELRRVLADPESTEPLRAAAARRLAALAAERSGTGRPLVPTADPANWWGTRAQSRSATPLRDPAGPVPLSASALSAILQCPAQWFLEREAGGASRVHQSANLGRILHALAERVARGELPADESALVAEVDRVWDRLAFRTPWSRTRERQRIEQAIGRFVRWHRANPRHVLGVEVPFAAQVDLDGEQVRLTGTFDRLEADAAGQAVVVDFKTGRAAPSNRAAERDLQLALYQYAVDAGALADGELAGGAAGSGGAELVQLGVTGDDPEALVQRQAKQVDGSGERELLREHLAAAAALVRAEHVPALPGEHCRTCDFTAICPAKGAPAVTAR